MVDLISKLNDFRNELHFAQGVGWKKIHFNYLVVDQICWGDELNGLYFLTAGTGF